MVPYAPGAPVLATGPRVGDWPPRVGDWLPCWRSGSPGVLKKHMSFVVDWISVVDWLVGEWVGVVDRNFWLARLRVCRRTI